MSTTGITSNAIILKTFYQHQQRPFLVRHPIHQYSFQLKRFDIQHSSALPHSQQKNPHSRVPENPFKPTTPLRDLSCVWSFFFRTTGNQLHPSPRVSVGWQAWRLSRRSSENWNIGLQVLHSRKIAEKGIKVAGARFTFCVTLRRYSRA